jgi:hypothetical protein
MSTAPATRPPEGFNAGNLLQRRLAAVRRRLRLVAVIRGAGWVLLGLLTAITAAGLLDWRFPLPAVIRAMLLVGILAGVGLVALRHLFRPLSSRMDDLSLALRIEEAHPVLNDALASTVQFLEQGGHPNPGESASMRREAVRRTLKDAAGCDFNRIVDSRHLRTAALLGVLALGAFVFLIARFPAVAGTALTRLFDPFGKHNWPTLTVVELEPFRDRIGRNESFELRGKVTGIIPPNATLYLRAEGLPPQDQTFPIRRESETSGQVVMRLSSAQVQKSFKFQVRANDFLSDPFEVVVLPPPVLTLLDGKPSPQLRLYFPAYTDLPSPQDLSPGTGNIEAIAGTQVTLRAAADRALRDAWIEYQPEVREAPLTLGLAPLGATHLGEALTVLAAGQAVWGRVPAEIDSRDPTHFHIDFQPPLGGMYWLTFEDRTGLSGRRQFELRLKADPAPTVHLERPSPIRDLLIALPSAEIPLQVVAEDPIFALRSVFLRYRMKRDAAPRSLVLYDERLALRTVEPWTGLPILATNPKFRPTRLELKRALSLRRLQHPDGSPLKDGDILILQACADDFDNVTVGKQPGASHEIEIRIVDRTHLDLTLNQEQARIQQDLLRLREKERDALKLVRDVENHQKRGDKFTPEEQDKLVQAEQLQQQIQERLGNRTEGLRAELARLMETLRNNGMQNSAVRDRMVDVNRELERLAEQELPQIQAKLTDVRRAPERAERTPQERKEEQERLQLEAREKEARAQALEKNEPERLRQEAEKLDQQAGQLEKDGKNSQAQQLKARAEKLRQDAQKLAQQGRLNDPDPKKEAERLHADAKELQAQAERLQQEKPEPMAKDAPLSPSDRQELSDARQHQEEVERTLNDLLNRLEPWSSSREIRGEAGKLLQDQKELQARLQELENQGLRDKTPDKLTPQERADLNALKEAQQKLEERAAELMDKMKRVADQREEKDPETAQELRQAQKQALAGNITGKMKNAQEQIGKNQLHEAQKNQQAAQEELKNLLKNLEDRREAELDRLAKKMREAEKKLEEIKKDQEELQKKVREAMMEPDKAKREEALKRLQREQERLKKEAQELGKQLQRLRADRASQALGQAGGQMDQAGQQLQRGGPAEQPQDDALDRLDEAQQQLQRAREQVEEELAREQLVRVADQLKRIKERHEALIKEAVRIQDDVLRRKLWERTLQASLLGLGRAQKGLGTELAELTRKELAGAPVLARMLERAAEAMDQANERMQTVGKTPPPLDATPDKEVARLQALALKRLQQVLDAIQQEIDAPLGQGGLQPDDAGQPQEGGHHPGDHIPPLAQLKLLKALEEEVRQNLADFKKDHPDVKNLKEPDRARYQELLKQRQDVRELFEELIRPLDEPKPGDRPAGKEKGEKK